MLDQGGSRHNHRVRRRHAGLAPTEPAAGRKLETAAGTGFG
jgi:hypothetical protein